MGWSYKRLWIRLAEREMKKTDLLKTAGINSTTLAKMGKNEAVTMGALERICEALQCNIEDIVEFVPSSDARRASCDSQG